MRTVALSLSMLAFVVLTPPAFSQAGPPLQCTVNTSVPPSVASQGSAVLVGDLILSCTGGVPTPQGQTVPQFNVQIFLNTNISSRILKNPLTEALLLVDEPAANNQFPCTQTTCQNIAGVALGPGQGQSRNVFQGQLSQPNSIVWPAVPIDPPGPSTTRIIRITNIRANASAPAATGPPPTSITEFVAVTGSQSVALTNPTQTVAFLQPGLAFAVRTAADSATGVPVTLSGTANTNFPMSFNAAPTFNVKFTEGFATSFRKRTAGSAATNPAGVADQNTPGQIYNTETGFFNSQFPAVNGLDAAGLADSGTRLIANFKNVPLGASLFVTVTPVTAGTSTTGVTARLVSTDATGAGAYSPTPPATGSYAQIPLSASNGIAVWEVLDPNPNAIESLSFGVVVSYAGNTTPAGQGNVNGDLAPVNASSASAAPLPRFTQASTALPAFTIVFSNLSITNSSPLANGVAGTGYAQQLFVTGGIEPYTWSIVGGALPDGLIIDSRTGVIGGTPFAAGTFMFTVQATDSAQPQGVITKSFTITINSAAPLIITTNPPLPDGVVGSPYPDFAFSAINGVTPLTWSITAGTFPPGLNLDAATGQVSGIPSRPGGFNFTVQVTDASRRFASKGLTINVSGGLTIVSNSPLPDATVASAYSSNIGVTGGTGPVTWVGRPPVGLTLNSATGIITGTPAASGTFTFPVEVIDSTGAAAAKAFTILVNAAGRDPKPSVSQNGISFSFTQGATPVSQSLSLANDGGGAFSFTATAANSPGGPSLSVSPGSGNVTLQSPAALGVTADIRGVLPGTYTGAILINSTAPPLSTRIPVTITVSSNQQLLALSQTGLTFTSVVGGGAPPSQKIGIANGGQGAMAWTVSATTLSGGGWLAASPGSGRSAAGSAVPTIDVSVNPAGLTAGDYYGQVQVSSSDAPNSPQSATVVLNVLPPAGNPGPGTQPTGFIFTAVAGGVSPSPQELLVSNLTATPLTFTSTRATLSGGAWFTASPPSGTAAAGVTRISIQTNPAGLAAGAYRGVLTLMFSDGSTRVINIVLVVAPQPPTSSKTSLAELAGCTPGTLFPLITSVGANFNLTAAWPVPVEVKVVDSCGDPMISGSVVLSFSNGDPALPMVGLNDSRWQSTWAPRNARSGVTITANASVPGTSLRGVDQISGDLKANPNPPVISAAGVVSAASFTAQGPLAPGTLFSIFGTKLADAQASASSLPLPTQLAGTVALIAGQTVPLLFSSDGQVNAILPADLAVNTPQLLTVRRGNTLSVPERLNLATAEPAIFTAAASGMGQGAITLTGTRTLAAPGSPAKAGGVVEIYAAGLGAVSPPVPSGTAAPVAPLSIATNMPAVTIGGIPANVLFAGLAPGFTGLYQLNVVVPSGVSPGDAVPVVLTVAGESSPPVTIAVQ